jgi:hypothetical protein
LEDISSLSFSKSIKVIKFSLYKRINDFSPVKDMAQLQVFRLHDNELLSLDFLGNLKNLKEVVLGSQKILNPDISPIMDLPKLERLYFRRKFFSKSSIEMLKKRYSNSEITIW